MLTANTGSPLRQCTGYPSNRAMKELLLYMYHISAIHCKVAAWQSALCCLFAAIASCLLYIFRICQARRTIFRLKKWWNSNRSTIVSLPLAGCFHLQCHFYNQPHSYAALRRHRRFFWAIALPLSALRNEAQQPLQQLQQNIHSR